MDTFRHIDISGDARQRGHMHGEQLRGEIAGALAWYRSVFSLDEATVVQRGRYFAGVIEAFNSSYASEIRAIAEAAGQDPFWLFALNARTEILALSQDKPANKCTIACFTGPPVLGQTWDWGMALEGLCAMMRIERPDGHVIEMMSEPGIIGKIGMNSAGVGVCLNILQCGRALEGVPIHVLLRAILDCQSAEQAAAMIAGAKTGTASNVAIADRQGRCFDFEFAGPEVLAPDTGNNTADGWFVHTNHYLARPVNAHDDPEFANSRTRMANTRAAMKAARSPGVDSLKAILSDRSNRQFPVFRPDAPNEDLGVAGTVATLIMDLAAGEMHVRKGNRADAAFTIYRAQ